MPHKEIEESLNRIEMILLRQLAGTLATALMIFDSHGTLLFYNEPAEPILGLRFEETGQILVSELPHMFTATDDEGQPLPPDVLPSYIVLAERRPAFRRLWMCGLDGVQHHLEVSAFPLIGEQDRFLGAISVLWETSEAPIAAGLPAWITGKRASAADLPLEGS